MPLGESVSMTLAIAGLFSAACCCIMGARYARSVSLHIEKARAAVRRRRNKDTGPLGMELVLLDGARVESKDAASVRLVVNSERLHDMMIGLGAINALTVFGWVRLSLPESGSGFFNMHECGSSEKPSEVSRLFGHGHVDLATVSKKINDLEGERMPVFVVVPPRRLA